jgi:F420 biosynthesis protein FbiB-like protein
VREELAREMGRVFRSDLEADGASAVEIEARVRASRRRLSTAPVLIIACLCPRDLQRYPDVDRQAAELTMGAQSVAAAVQNLLLAAAEAGLGAAWMCAPLFCPEVVRRTLALASDWEPQALITVGWPDESPRPSRRRNQDDVVVHL